MYTAKRSKSVAVLLIVFGLVLSTASGRCQVLKKNVSKKNNCKMVTVKVEVCCPEEEKEPEFTPQSCFDYLEKDHKSNGFYKIYDMQGSNWTVYCDMNSEPGAAWTLVESFSLENAGMAEFKSFPLQTNAPVNENAANWNKYRMSLAMMTHVRSQSTHWRATCNFPTHGVNYTDYVRANFTDFDIMTFLGKGVCNKVEYVNIRGHHCTDCTSKWWQYLDKSAPHIDSSYSAGCQFDPRPGAVSSEDNFGLYGHINSKFRCTSGPTSTTNWWFGGYQ